MSLEKNIQKPLCTFSRLPLSCPKQVSEVQGSKWVIEKKSVTFGKKTLSVQVLDCMIFSP